MKTHFSIWSQFYNTREPEEAILEFEKDGLKHIELSSEHSIALLERKGTPTEIGAAFADFCALHGVAVLQAHLIFPSNIVTDPSVCDILVRQIEMLEAMGVRAAVLHGDPMKDCAIPYSEKIEKNIEALKEFLPKVEQFGVRICLENLSCIFRGIDEILYAIDRVGSDMLGICLDTGHLNITKTSTQREFILKAGNLLAALHVADNEGEVDQHIVPFGRGNVDFFEVVSALRAVGYEGLFNYEIGGDSGKCPVPVKHFKYIGIKATYDYIMGNIK